MKKFLTLSLAIGWLAVILSPKVIAQSEVDSELWAGVKSNVSIKKRWRFEVEYQKRWDNNISNKKVTFQEFALRYKVNKWFLVKPSFRIAQAPEFNDNWNRASLDLYARIRKKGAPLQFTNRLRVQYRYGLNKATSELVLRNRFGFKYNTGKLVDPFISFELFVNDLRLDFTDLRLKLGADWRISKQWTVNVFYGLERQAGRKTNNTDHIIGFTGVWSIKVKKKKIKKDVQYG